jgi:tRNA(Ile)-lysidine synthase TilS/MesJ
MVAGGPSEDTFSLPWRRRECPREAAAMDLRFHKNHAKWFVTPVMRAIRRYALIEAGDRVCVGLSGGKDSTTLLYILRYLQRYSHLKFELSAIHVRTSPDYETTSLRDYCNALEIPYSEAALELPSNLAGEKECSICARLKRGAAAQALAPRGIRKLAYGHHADDAAETLLMNIVQNKKLGSFSPKVVVEGSPVIIIRPMIYLNEKTIASVHRHAGLPLLDFTCPYAQHNVRQRYKETVRLLEESLGVRSLSRHVVSALENVDETNLWRSLRGEA